MGFLYYLCCFLIVFLIDSTRSRDLTKEPGHLKPFGSGRHNIEVEEIDGFPSPKKFFEEYAFPKKPLIMKGAGFLSPAMKLWSDDYFLSLPVPESNKITVETRKKENRTNPVVDMNFKDFVKVYNNTQQYMVHPVPDFLRKDVLIPCPLQCPSLTEKSLVENIMWFSSGGTKSVVHTDSVDNINCLYRGQKELWMVDPSKYRDKVDIDRPEGSYSNVDVDRVDYTKYPGLADVEFYHAKLNAGDCLFIPFKWIHQVRSYGSNLAVNLWWNHHNNHEVNLDLCNEVCDEDLRLGDIIFAGFGQVMDNVEGVKDHFEGLVDMKKNVDFEMFKRTMIGNDLKFLEGRGVDDVYLSPLLEMYQLLDVDKDQSLTMSDIKKVTQEAWTSLRDMMKEFEEVIENTLQELGPPEGYEPDIEPEELEEKAAPQGEPETGGDKSDKKDEL